MLGVKAIHEIVDTEDIEPNRGRHENNIQVKVCALFQDVNFCEYMNTQMNSAWERVQKYQRESEMIN